MNVPLLDLRGQYATIRAEVQAAIERVVESQHFILGPEVRAFEDEIARYTRVPHAIGVSSGTDALLVALMALDIGRDDEIITSPFSFFATAGVIHRIGARPVFADIEPDSFNMDAAKAIAAMTVRTRALLPVHLYGRMADVGPLCDAAGENRIAVIEDAAQAIGSHDEQLRRAGSIGDIGCFSFFPTKNLGGFGDAGLVTVRDATLARRIEILRVHGMDPKYYHREVGGNFRIDALQAAVLRVKLRHLDAWAAARRRNADRYRGLFADANLLDVIGLPADSPGHVYNQFVVRVPDRDAVRESLAERGIGTEIYYPLPLHLQECFAYLGHGPGDFPQSERASREALALPIYPELTETQQAAVVHAFAAHFGRASSAPARS
ncbi:MAG: DegT/DnrJ/EryC1/StrS family aminotransferase [Longimicrobiales bacterium]